MRVLMFGWEFPPHISGGLGTACYGLTKAMAKQDLEIIFVVPRAWGDEDQSTMQLVGANNIRVKVNRYQFSESDVAQANELEYVEIGANLIPYVTVEEYYDIVNNKVTIKKQLKKHTKTKELDTISFVGGYGESLLQEVGNYAFIASQIAKQFDFDIIHAHDWLTYDAGISAKQASGKPLVIHVHATEFDRSGMHVNQYVYDIERRGMHMADEVITVSNLTRSTVLNHYGVPEYKVTTVYNGVDSVQNEKEKFFEKHIDDKIVTFLGRITYQKGPEYFLEAAAKVLQRKSNVKFVMAGSGDMLEKMMWRAAELGISKNFYFTGFLRGDDVIHMLSISDVYVMPSVSEPFGISPLEAMRSNVPVIISKQSGVSEVLQHAIKIDFWDVDSMADAIYGIISYDGLRDMFSSHAKAEVETIKWDTAAAKIKDIYTKTLSK
ncbi:MAG TPA: glycosyltransferase family 4 protein [Bacteroidales bacterium]|nr:MAG: Glycogen synthase [Bacteroidetes bacterium ADurb.Bin217]HPM11882.1 glycosyltransferase family 4 protein [Bacteroidales bacterium]